MRSLCASLLILALQPVFAFAAPQMSTQKDELWRMRSQAITDDLLNDARQLPPLRRAELLTRLGHRWWRYDKRRAGSWIGNAIDIVEQVPNKKNSDERRQRLETTRLLLKIVAPLNEEFSTRLVTVLSNKDGSPDIERIENANAMIEAARGFAFHDRKRAAELGALALRLGPPTEVAGLFNHLHRVDDKLAEDFLAQALATAKQESSGQLLTSLSHIIFPPNQAVRSNNLPSSKLRSPHVKEPYISPDHQRIELLQLYLAFLDAGYKGNGIDCGTVLIFIGRLMSEFERLIPQQATVVRQALKQCQPPVQLTPQQLQAISDRNKLKTVEELLNAAVNEKDLEVRTVLLEEPAARLAYRNKDYELAFKILDGMSKEARTFIVGSWESMRWGWAAYAARDHYTNGRILEMNRVLNAVPVDLQPFAKIDFVGHLPQKPDGEGTLALQFLNYARAGLRQSDRPDIEKYGYFFVVMRLLLKYDPPAAGAAFKEAVASLNRAEQEKKTKDRKLLDHLGLARTLPLSLLEMDEIAVKEGIASITSVENRVQLRLELLGETLRRVQVQP